MDTIAGTPARARLLIVDDDEVSCRLVKAIFTPAGFQVIAAFDGASGVKRAAADRPDLVLLDLHMPGLNGLEALAQIKSANPGLPVLMLTGTRDVKMAVRAMQAGAADYLTKPVDPEEILIVVRRVLQTRSLEIEVEDLRRRASEAGAGSLASQMGPSAPVKDVVEQVETVAASTFSVLILGESGTGKELVAQAIHRRGDRRGKPFVALDCGAIPETLAESELFGHERGAFTGADRARQGQFQIADGGTCLLDEVGNLPASLQMKLLRVLESREVQAVGAERAAPIDVRFVAATNCDLRARAAEGRFRADLYFRLAQYTIALPPLRQRLEDIPFLTRRFVQEVSIELRRPIVEVLPGAIELLQQHAWPGNVRELRNVIRQAVLRTKELVIDSAVLRLLLGSPSSGAAAMISTAGGQSLKAVAAEAAHAAECHAIREALRGTRGNKSQAAKQLRTDYKTLHVKMRALGIQARDFSA